MKTINKNIIFAEENIIAHGCNAQGKMGSGVAKAIRARWPEAYYKYRERYEKEGLKLGTICLVNVTESKWIANCITQQYYGYDSKAYASLDAIKYCIKELAETARQWKMSVALPPIGCGLGGLNWSEVGPVIEEIFDSKQVKFQVYDYRVEKWQ